MLKRILSVILVLTLVFVICSCGLTKDAPIDSEWEFVTLTMDGDRTDKGDVDSEDEPKFKVLDDDNCVFTLLGKEHHGILEEEDGVYYVSFDDGNTIGERALKITINHQLMVIEFIPIDCRVVMKAK